MIRLLLVDDHAIFRSGLRRLLSDEPDLVVTGEARDGQEALEQLRQGSFDLILLDINMTGRSGLEVLKRVRAEWPRQPVLMLSMYPEGEYALMALRSGAQGYLSKDAEASELVAAIRVAAAGGRYLSPRIVGDVLVKLNDADEAPLHHRLSARERQILQLIVGGTSLTGIGQRMFLSVKTISSYRSRILAKLALGSNAELVRYALKHGLSE